MLRLLLRLARCTSGTAAIEGIIILPLAISLMAGGIEFGRLLSAYDIADKSMRAAARYLAHVPHAATNGWGLTNAQNLAVCGKIDSCTSDEALIPGWAPGTVQCTTCDNVAAGTSEVIHLQAAVPYAVLMLAAVGLPNTYTLSVQHEERLVGDKEYE